MTEDQELKAMETSLGVLRELKPDERERVLSWLAARLGVVTGAQAGHGLALKSAAQAHDRLGTIKQFLSAKRPGDDVARATTLAYFLTHGQSQPAYTTADLTRGRLDAALATFNMSRAVSHAVRSGYITAAGKRGSYQITSTGEALVEAMPDSEAMKNLRLQGPRRRRRGTPTNRAGGPHREVSRG